MWTIWSDQLRDTFCNDELRRKLEVAKKVSADAVVKDLRRAVMTISAHGDLHPRPLDRTRRMTCFRMSAASSPEGRLPGRRSERTGLPVAASKIWIGWK